ncbi:MAG: MGMT family protein [Elusimicrobiales bacterium]
MTLLRLTKKLPPAAQPARPALPKRVLSALEEYPPFYRKVWLACAAIPRGCTRSYGEIARDVGSPKAARAVGQALSKNPFWPHVPCHRVVSSGGGLGGFSGAGGLKRKKQLLEAEVQ